VIKNHRIAPNSTIGLSMLAEEIEVPADSSKKK
jgi:hypothetical protein